MIQGFNDSMIREMGKDKRKYRVRFEFLGRPGSCTIKAGSAEAAREILRARLLINEVVPADNPIEEFMRGFGWLPPT